MECYTLAAEHLQHISYGGNCINSSGLFNIQKTGKRAETRTALAN
jgi:hypothetical protein